MKTKTLWGQVAASLLVVVASALTPSYVVPMALGTVILGWWAVLDVGYAVSLGRVRRAPRRVSGDHQVAAQTLLLGVVGLVAGFVAFVDHGLWITQSVALAVCLSGLAFLGCTVFASSLVDWYYIRPRIDGVVRSPPCRSSRDEAWMSVTRFWYQHRAIAELLVIGAIAVSFTALLAAIFIHGAPGVEVFVSAAGVPLGLLCGLQFGTLQTLRNYGMAPPELWLGDLLKDREGGSSYLLHVDVRGLVVREWSPEESRWHQPRRVPFKEMEARRFNAIPFDGCTECSLINPKCESEATRQCGGRSRFFVF